MDDSVDVVEGVVISWHYRHALIVVVLVVAGILWRRLLILVAAQPDVGLDMVLGIEQ